MDAVFEKKIKEFEKLDHESKRKKCNDMLEILKGSGNIFGDLYEMLQSLGWGVSDNLLISIYSGIQNAISHINNEELKEALGDMEKLREKVLDIRQREKEQREKENPEELLEEL